MNLEKPTLQLFKEWTKGNVSVSDFNGVLLSELDTLASHFHIDIDVFEFKDNILLPIRRKEYTHQKIMRLLLINESHFGLIKNIDAVCKAFGCFKCGKTWRVHSALTRHEKTCTGDRRIYTYPGGGYAPNLTKLERLVELGLKVDPTYVFPYWATYDFEAYFTKDNLPKTKTVGTTTYTSRHNLLSIGTSSNITEFGTKCWVKENDDEDPQIIVDKWIDYLEAMSDFVFEKLSKGHFKEYYDTITRWRNDQLSKPKHEQNQKKLAKYDMMEDILDEYLHQLPVVGFNSGKYDINVIKPYFVRRVLLPKKPEQQVDGGDTQPKQPPSCHGAGVAEVDSEDVEIASEDVEVDREDVEVGEVEVKEGDSEDPEGKEESEDLRDFDPKVLKRNNQFIAVTTSKLRFLDITQFIAPGFSYEKYLAAYNVVGTKGHFPYEYVTSVSKLNEPLPAREHFYSDLKEKHLSEEAYKEVVEAYNAKGMSSLKELLIWYQEKDVEPFVEALKVSSAFYHTQLKLDMLKDAVSVPGLCLRYLFKSLPHHTVFSLIGEKDKDLHETIRRNLVGGPAIVFHRYHAKGKTYIRGNKAKVVETCLGLDMNALYLSAFQKEMPTECGIRYKREEDGFLRPRDNKIRWGALARTYLEWTAHDKNIQIWHKFNRKEKMIVTEEDGVKKTYFADGFDPKNQTIYEFHGCSYHGHEKPCPINSGKIHNPLLNESHKELRAKTAEKYAALEKLGYNVVEKWECEWEKERKENPAINDFLRTHLPTKNKYPQLSVDDVRTKVRSRELFGMVRCDIRVPKHLESKFSEMQPIFKNVHVGREDIGLFMKEYAENHKDLPQARKTLVGSFFGNDILLSTPLLKWYLEHGLEITDVHEVIQYQPKACFKPFVDTVSANRRAGDVSPDKKILAETFKLLGNSAYGKTLEARDSHKSVAYTDGQGWTKLVNDPLFRTSSQLGEDMYEVESAQKEVKWDLPLQIGFFTYQYAKLRMLEFYYDFLDRFISRDDFQLLEMDTDSMYMALSQSHLDKLVKKEDKREYFSNKCHWFASEHCDNPVHKAEYVAAKKAGREWKQEPCCTERQNFDKRTPGLMKVEWQGDVMVCLCPKTYFGSGGSGDKLSCKGLNKNINDLTEKDFLEVLLTGEKGCGRNKGFRVVGNVMYTYVLVKGALSYLYIKRIVLGDGVSTAPTRV